MAEKRHRPNIGQKSVRWPRRAASHISAPPPSIWPEHRVNRNLTCRARLKYSACCIPCAGVFIRRRCASKRIVETSCASCTAITNHVYRRKIPLTARKRLRRAGYPFLGKIVEGIPLLCRLFGGEGRVRNSMVRFLHFFCSVGGGGRRSQRQSVNSRQCHKYGATLTSRSNWKFVESGVRCSRDAQRGGCV